jgi:hypothetical protein
MKDKMINNLPEMCIYFGVKKPSELAGALERVSGFNSAFSIFSRGNGWHHGDDWTEIDCTPSYATGFMMKFWLDWPDYTAESAIYKFPVSADVLANKIMYWRDHMNEVANKPSKADYKVYRVLPDDSRRYKEAYADFDLNITDGMASLSPPKKEELEAKIEKVFEKGIPENPQIAFHHNGIEYILVNTIAEKKMKEEQEKKKREEARENSRQEAYSDLVRKGVHEYKLPLVESLVNHIVYGLGGYGDFIYAVLCNDLGKAACQADSGNLKALGRYGQFLVHQAPTASYGSKEKVQAWKGMFND